MPRVLITDNLSAAGLNLLRESGLEVDVRSGLTPAQVREALHDADGIIIRSGTTLTPEILTGQPRLKAIVRAGVGVDNIDLPSATREGIVVMNTPAGNTTSTAEHTLAMLLALSRNIGPAAASMKAGKWDRKSFTGTQLAGKTLAVVGLGRIGMAVARRALGLEMKVVGYDPFLSAQKGAEQGIEVVRNIDDLIDRCDFLTVHTPLTEETRGVINAQRLARMRKGARIINCARGGIIDEGALADAIESGHIAGAAMDVFLQEPPTDRRLINLPQVLATPHLGASTEEAQEMVAIEAAEILSGFLMRGEVRHAVNMMPPTAAEMADVRVYLDLARRLGLLLAQSCRSNRVTAAQLVYRGAAASKNTKLLTSAFAAGLLEQALDDYVNIVNAELLAKERGIRLTESTSTEQGDFATLIRATVETETGEIEAAGTVFGRQFQRLVRFDGFSLDAHLDGVLLLYRHRDVPGQIGFLGSVLGKHGVNIAHMALGRTGPGGNALGVFNVDSLPPAAALEEIALNPVATGVEVVQLPPQGEPLPWLVSPS